MGLDAIGAFVLARELNAKIGGGRIEKVNMPSKDEVILVVKSRGEKRSQNLLLSVSPDSPRVHITTKQYENPLSALAFLMHLRKHIGGGIISSIEAVKGERIINFNISSCDELGYKKEFTLVAELIGRFSNLILVDESGIVTDAVKRVTIDTFSARAVVSGMKYSLPPKQNDKISAIDDTVYSIVSSFTGGKLADYLLTKLYGFSPASLKQVVFEVFGTLSPLPEQVKNNSDKLISVLRTFGEKVAPCLFSLNGKITDFFFTPYTHLDGEFKAFPSLGEAMDAFYQQKEENGVIFGRSSTLLQTLKSAIKKNERSIALIKEKISQSLDLEDDRVCGELVTANIYRIKKGDSEIVVDDYYCGNQRKITLDTTLTPQQNAQSFYKAYGKKRRTITHGEEQLIALEERGEYLQSLLFSLEKASLLSEIAEIETEMTMAGLIKKAKTKKQVKPSSPLSLTVKGYKVLIGKNNLQNDKLVRSSDGGWLWLHAQKIHGSHAVIQSTSVPQEVVNEVASFVAYYSKASLSANVPVDYTLVKFVKKPSGALPGKVIYTHQQTVNVTPKKPE